MSKILKFVAESDRYTQPYSLISFLDNKIALTIFFFLKNFRFLSPNLITGVSFFLFLISVPLLFLKLDYLFVVFIFLAYTFDNVDGIWARFHNQTSLFGAWFDSTLDRIKDIIILIAFVFMFKGLLNVIVIMSIFFYLVYLILVLHSKVYLNLESPKDNNFYKKKFRIISFGPAEFYLLISVIVIFPDKFKIIPLIILSIYFLLMMTIALFRSIKNINTLKIKE